MQSGVFSDSFEQFLYNQQNPHFTHENFLLMKFF